MVIILIVLNVINRFFTDFRCISEVCYVWQIQKDQKERDDMNNEAQDDDGIAADFIRCPSAQQPKGNSPAHFSDSDENSRQPHQLLRRLANRFCKSNTRRVNTAEKRELEACGREKSEFY